MAKNLQNYNICRESNMALPYSEVFLSMLNIWLNTSGFCEKVGLNSGNATPALQV